MFSAVVGIIYEHMGKATPCLLPLLAPCTTTDDSIEADVVQMHLGLRAAWAVQSADHPIASAFAYTYPYANSTHSLSGSAHVQFISNNAVVFINTYVPLCVCVRACTCGDIHDRVERDSGGFQGLLIFWLTANHQDKWYVAQHCQPTIRRASWGIRA